MTVIGAPLKARAFAAVAGRIADTGANIDRIERMARYPVTAIDLHVSGADTATLRSVLSVEAAAQGLDIAVQPANLSRHGMRLVVLDVDSTLIQGEVIEMLAAHAGLEDEVAVVTEAAMSGHIDFETALRDRVAHLEGLDEKVLDEVYDVDRAQSRRADHGPDAAAAGLPVRHRLGRVQPDHRPPGRGPRHPLLARQRARDRRREADRSDHRRRRRPCRQGHGAAAVRRRRRRTPLGRRGHRRRRQRPRHANAAGLGIAYNAKPVLREAADTSVNVPYLDAIMYILGISREEIEAADPADGFTTPAPPI